MGRHSKKSASRQMHSTRRYNSSENISYYFLAAAGLFVLIFILLGVLGYAGIL